MKATVTINQEPAPYCGRCGCFHPKDQHRAPPPLTLVKPADDA